MNSITKPTNLTAAKTRSDTCSKTDSSTDHGAEPEAQKIPALSLTLKLETSQAWVDAVMSDFDSFLIDHAACERKAAGMALSLCTHYPDRAELVRSMSALAVEELMHYREVLKWMEKRGIIQVPDEKDPYINNLRKSMGKGKHAYLRDRLLLAAIIERRGHERFGLVAQALPKSGLQQFYARITRSEDRHHELFLNLAERYCSGTQNASTNLASNNLTSNNILTDMPTTINNDAPSETRASLALRLEELLNIEADIVASLPIHAKLH